MISVTNRPALYRTALRRATRARTGANRARHRTPRRRRDDSHRALRRHRREESARTCGPAAYEVLHREPQSVLATHLLFSALGCFRFPATCAVVVVIVDLIALVDWRRCRRVLREGARSGRPTQAQAVDPSRT